MEQQIICLVAMVMTYLIRMHLVLGVMAEPEMIFLILMQLAIMFMVKMEMTLLI